MALPYFRFFPGSWLGSPRIQSMTLEEEAAYFRLLAQMWELRQDCTLPDDDATLARMCRATPEQWKALRARLIDGPMAVFERTEDGRLTNRRLRQEWDRAVGRSRQARAAVSQRKDRGGEGLAQPAELKPDKADPKRAYAENVRLTEAEFGRLVERFGEPAARRMIEILDHYKGAHGRRYRSDYRAILSWVVDRYHQEAGRKNAPRKLDDDDVW